MQIHAINVNITIFQILNKWQKIEESKEKEVSVILRETRLCTMCKYVSLYINSCIHSIKYYKEETRLYGSLQGTIFKWHKLQNENVIPIALFTPCEFKQAIELMRWVYTLCLFSCSIWILYIALFSDLPKILLCATVAYALHSEVLGKPLGFWAGSDVLTGAGNRNWKLVTLW